MSGTLACNGGPQHWPVLARCVVLVVLVVAMLTRVILVLMEEILYTQCMLYTNLDGSKIRRWNRNQFRLVFVDEKSHTIYLAISTSHLVGDGMDFLSIKCVCRCSRLCQCPWKSTNLCSAMDAMEIHTIPVYPYRARVCQRPCISTQSDSMPCGCHGNPHYPGFANAHAYPPSLSLC